MSNLKNGTGKIQLTVANNSISSLDNNAKCVVGLKSNNIEIMINEEADEFKKQIFDSRKMHIKII